MRIALIQSKDLENGKIPHQDITQLVETKSKPNDFWILPEAFDTGWKVTENTEFSGSKNIDYFKQLSEKYNITIGGSYYVKDNGKFYNRFSAVTPQGEIFSCEKRHLFGDFEKGFVTPGNTILSFTVNDIKFRVIICYDLRFPVWCRNSDEYDALICVSQWPLSREFDRNLLLSARAMENVAYVLNANALGGSAVYLPNGKLDLKVPTDSEIAFYNLDIKNIRDIRQQKKYLLDADNFSLEL